MSDKLYKVSLEVFVDAENEKEAIEIGKQELKNALEGKHFSAGVEAEEVDTDEE